MFFYVDAQEEAAPSPEHKVEAAALPTPITSPAKPPSATTNAATIKLVQPSKKTKNELRGDTGLVNLLRNATEASKREDGWSHLGTVGQYLVNRSSFTPKNFGYSTLKPLIVATDLFELHEDGNHVRAKPAGKTPKKATKNPA